MKRTVYRLLSGCTVFIVLYVLYMHAVSLNAFRNAPSPWDVSLGETQARSSIAVATKGGVQDETRNAARCFSRGSADTNATVDGQHPIGRLRAGLLAIDAQVSNGTLAFGFGTIDHRLQLALADELDGLAVHISGARGPNGVVSSIPKPVGRAALSIDDTAALVLPGLHLRDTHNWSLHFESDEGRLSLLADHYPVASWPVGWREGTKVFGFFSLSSSSEGALDGCIKAFRWDPLPSGTPLRGLDLNDVFLGAPNPVRWSPQLSQQLSGASALTLDAEGGLRFRATSAASEVESAECTYPILLAPIEVQTSWKVKALRDARVGVRIENVLRTRRAAFEMQNIDGTLQIVPSYHPEGSMHLKRDLAKAIAVPAELEITLRYQPLTRTMRIETNGQSLVVPSLELRRGEAVRVCLDANVGLGGELDATVRRVQIHVAPY
jgi:hypothetical protein